MVTIKQYADSRGVSPQSVYKLLKTHTKALEGLFTKERRRTLLTDDAVKYLDSVKESHPQVIEVTTCKEDIERLTTENKLLLIKVNELQERLLESNEVIANLQQEKIHLLEQKNKSFLARLFTRKEISDE